MADTDSLSPTHVCFLQAYEQLHEGKISWEQYLHYDFLHYMMADGCKLEGGAKWELMHKDPFGYTLYEWQFKRIGGKLWTEIPQITGIQDTTPLQAVFQAYKRGTVKEVETKLSDLTPITAASMRRSLVLLALQDRKLEMFRFIMQDGQISYDAWPSHAFEDLANGIDGTEPEFLAAIQQSAWRSSHLWRAPGERDARGD